MLRAVVDTNVVISGLLSPAGTPAAVLAAAGDQFKLVWTAGIVAECVRVLRYARVDRRLRARGDAEEARVALARIAASADLVAPDLLPAIRVVEGDPSDDLLVATALAGGARVLVTGDRRHLLARGEILGIRIVDPAAFAAELGLVAAPRRKGPAGSVHEPVAPWGDGVAELVREARRWARATAGRPHGGASLSGRSAPTSR